MTASEAFVISMRFAATPVEIDEGESISAGFRCISVSISGRRSNNFGSHTACLHPPPPPPPPPPTPPPGLQAVGELFRARDALDDTTRDTCRKTAVSC